MTHYPWKDLQPKQSFFVAGLPPEAVIHEVMAEAFLLRYTVKTRTGILRGKYGVLFTRVR